MLVVAKLEHDADTFTVTEGGRSRTLSRRAMKLLSIRSGVLVRVLASTTPGGTYTENTTAWGGSLPEGFFNV